MSQPGSQTSDQDGTDSPSLVPDPKAALQPHYAFIRDLFNDTAPYYDTVNRIFSLGSGNWYRRRCLRRAGLTPGQTVLDVAIGTGLIAQAARDITGTRSKIIGLDLSEAMLAAARRKLDIPLIQGMAEKLPLADEAVDFVVMGYAIRHIADLDACFQEFRRVLRPGGTLLLLEVSSPGRAIFKSTLAQYLGRVVPRLSHWVTGKPELRSLMDYHWQTMEDCVPPPVILDSMARCGFGPLACEGWFDLFRTYVGQRQGS